jgi:integrase
MPLTNSAIQAAKPAEKPYKLPDGNGLHLEVRPSGAKLWRYRYRIGGKENLFALGEWYLDRRTGHVSLEAARRGRDAARDLVKKGVHPAHSRQDKLRIQLVQNDNTFKVVAEEWISRKERNWSPRYAAQIKHVLKTDVYPAIGSRPINAVNAQDILKILVDVEARGANAFAHLIRQWTSAIFRYGVATLRAENDPSAALRGAVIRNKVRHAKALSRDQIKSLLEAINVYRGEPATLFGLQLMLVTFVRTIEMRGARWDEINFKKSEWRIPADRMKMREEHIVPLSKQAVAILKALYVINGHRDFLFPNRRNPKTFITSTTLNRALERMGFLGDGSIGFSAHGFRATASTMLNEAGFRSDVIERQLAHQERNGVRASYNHATYMEERRVMMQVWADMVDDIRKETSSNQISFLRALTFQPA